MILHTLLLLISIPVVIYGPYTIVSGVTDSSLGFAIGIIITVLFSTPAFFIALYSFRKITYIPESVTEKQIKNSTEPENGEWFEKPFGFSKPLIQIVRLINKETKCT